MIYNIILVIILVISGGVIIQALTFNDDYSSFCILGVLCEEEILSENHLNFSGYIGEDEGIVKNRHPYHESFFETLEDVINVSEKKYNNIIRNISNQDSFNEIYKEYIEIFENKYTTEIDKNFEKDYIQNLGELIDNNYYGDCDDYAIWFYIIAKNKDLEVRYIIGFRVKDDFSITGHAWIQIRINNEWIDYDSTSDSIGENIISKRYSDIYYYKDEAEKNGW